MKIDITLQRISTITKTVDITEDQFKLLCKGDPEHPFDDALPFLDTMVEEMEGNVDYDTWHCTYKP